MAHTRPETPAVLPQPSAHENGHKSVAQIMMDEVVADSLRPAALGLGVIFAFLAVIHFVTVSASAVPGIVSAVTAVILFALFIILGNRRFSSTQTHLLTVVIAGLAVFNDLLRLYLLDAPGQTMVVLVIIVISAGLFFLSSWALAVVLAGTWVGWLGVVWAKGQGNGWQDGVALLLATAVSALIFYLRLRTMRRYEHLREESERRRQEASYRAGQLETGLAVGQSITSILDPEILLERVVALIHERYNYYYVGIFLIDEEGQLVREEASAGEMAGPLVAGGLCLKVGEEGLIGWVAANGSPARVDDVARDGRYMQVAVLSETKSELDLPLRVGDRLLGVLDLQSKKYAAFPESDMSFLQLLADQVAIAIYNASLFEREKSARHLAETLHQTGHLLNSTLNWNEVLDLILQQLADIVPYDRASMMIPRGQELEFVAFHGYPEGFEPGNTRISIEEDTDEIYREIYQTKRPLCIPDVLQRPDWQQVPTLPQARSWLGVPLTRSDEVIGMLSLTRETPDPYNDDEISLASAFASQAAVALQNARVYDRMAQFNQMLEYEVRSRTSAIQEAHAQLERLNQTKSDFISIVSHELRTPLTLVKGYSQMMLKDNALLENEFLQQLADGIHSGAIRMGEIVNSMLEMLKIDNQALELYPEPVSIAPMLQMVALQFEESLVARHLTLTIEDMSGVPGIEADFEALQKVFYHLIINAIKYTPDGGCITISGRVLVDSALDLPQEGIEVVVQDTGIGIDEDSHDLIFTKFYQTGKVSLHSSGKTAFKAGGPGLGLAIARGIVEAHRGKLWVESQGQDEENLPGSAFHVALPLRQR
ncbi:MAG: GAF domain-containing protein [Ardenticatenaceae bacterium]|nr:GAF domain-containing protein [Ardenticatenaceae bacterium]